MVCRSRTGAVITPALLAAALAISAPSTVRAERPSTERLIAAGAGMAIPTYFAGVALHEGSHAVVALLYGRKLVHVQLLPACHPRNGRFYFGYVSYSPPLPRPQRTFSLLAPKLVNLAMLGGYGALVAADTLPANHYGQLALAVWATGQWVDFSKDLALFWRPHDVNLALEINGYESHLQRTPWRLVHLGLSAAAAYFIVDGYRRIFADEAPAATPVIVPLARFSL